MKAYIHVSIFFSVLLFIQCSSYRDMQSNTFEEKKVLHERIAVLPFQVKVEENRNNYNLSTKDEIKELEFDYGLKMQEIADSYLSSRNITVSIQSSSITNSKLKEAKIDFNEISSYPTDQLALILDVDAILIGEIHMEQPLSAEQGVAIEVAKVAETVLFGTNYGSRVKGITNRGIGNINVFDGRSGDKIWSSHRKIEMKTGSTIEDIMYVFLNKTTRNIPYKK